MIKQAGKIRIVHNAGSLHRCFFVLFFENDELRIFELDSFFYAI